MVKLSVVARRIANGSAHYRVHWPAPSPDPDAADPPKLAEHWSIKERKERQLAAWRIAQQKARKKKAGALYRQRVKENRQKPGPKPGPKKSPQLIAFIAKAHYSNRQQKVFERMPELQTWSRAPRNIDEIQAILIAMAKKVGSIYGVSMSVGRRADQLVFVDEAGEDIIDPGGIGNPATTIMCAQNHELDSGDFLKLFAARSLYAALTIRFNQLDESTSQVPAFRP